MSLMDVLKPQTPPLPKPTFVHDSGTPRRNFLELQVQVLTFVKDHPGCTFRQVADHIQVKDEKLYPVFGSLSRDGRLIKTCSWPTKWRVS